MKNLQNFILEIGTEEIPARFMPEILASLKELAERELKANRLEFQSLKVWGTLRRLILSIENLAPGQPDLTEEIKGPPKQVAFDSQGQPQPAALGFARAQKVSVKDLFTKTLDGREYLFVKLVRKGQKTEKILPEILFKICTSLYLPLSMRWADGVHKFIRPVHWILALYGERLINFNWAGQKSGRLTFGHCFLKPGQQKIPAAKKYFSVLEKSGVVADPEARRQLILKKLKKLNALVPEYLLEETVYLVEAPEAILGSFDKKFLSLPAQILELAMEKYQKYFPLKDKNEFVVVVDGLPTGELRKIKIKNIKSGNEKVLTARLTDARFFYEHDLKTPLENNLEKLKGLLFYKNLGTMFDKVGRSSRIVSALIEAANLKGTETEKTLTGALKLFKNDLVTALVGEIDLLQGIAGSLYARAQGFSEKVAQAIEEHYKPRFSGDSLPESLAGQILAVADKIDTLVAFFAAGLKPTGSSDPFALRRQATGLISILTAEKSRLNFGSLEDLTNLTFEILKNQSRESAGRIRLSEKITPTAFFRDLEDFLFQRLKQNLLEEKFRYDLVEAVLARGLKMPVFILKNLRSLLSVVTKEASKTEDFKKFVETAVRVKRLAAQGQPGSVNQELLKENSERILWDIYQKIKPNFEKNLSSLNWTEAFFELKEFVRPVDNFFVEVLVMHQDEAIKTNRLALLQALDGLFRELADFEKVVLG